jgi:hypothetical protein
LSAERSHWGDHSFTYKAPGLHFSDSWSMAAPVVLAKYSPIASAVALDGTATVDSGWLSTPPPLRHGVEV